MKLLIVILYLGFTAWVAAAEPGGPTGITAEEVQELLGHTKDEEDNQKDVPENQPPARLPENAPGQNSSGEYLFLSPTMVTLTDKEKKSVKVSREWREQAVAEVSPIRAENGATQFVFGMEQPSIVCSPLNVTDVQLQRGESVQSVLLGDTARWRVDVVLSGSNKTSANDTPHLIIKPLDVGLKTSMVVTTDRRTYHFSLHSHRTEYVARVTFAYPSDISSRIFAQQQVVLKERELETIPDTSDRLSELNFNYRISGKAPWKPVRVYNDGRRTVLEMPTTMSQMEAPSLLVIQNGEKTLVNYRVRKRRYIVDSIFSEAVLIAGVGRRQERVTVKYRGIPKE